MDDTCTYQIEVRGQADENDLNAMSPLHLTVMQVAVDKQHPAVDKQHPAVDKRHPAMDKEHPTVDKERPDASMLLTVCTDQSGLIGLLRHLHARGLVLLSVHRE